MKIRQTISVNEPFSMDVNVTHTKTRFFVSNTKDFEVAETTEYQLVQDINNSLNILSKVIDFDFTNRHKKYYIRTETELSDGTVGGLSRTSVVTRDGIREGYTYSDIIIKSPLITLNNNVVTHLHDLIFTIGEAEIYSSNGLHTSTSFKVFENGILIMERLNDTNMPKQFTIPKEKLKADRTLRLEVKFHYGVAESVWSSYLFNTKTKNNDFHVEFEKEDGNVSIYTNRLNFLEVKTTRSDLVSIAYTIHDKKTNTLVTDNTSTIQLNPLQQIPTIVIDGNSLTNNKKYRIKISCSFINDTVSNEYEFVCNDGVRNHRFSDHGTSHFVGITSSIIATPTHKCLAFTSGSMTPVINNSQISKLVRYGSKYLNSVTDVAIDTFMDASFPCVTKIIDDLLVVVGGRFVNSVATKIVKIFPYDYVNEMPLNQIAPITVELGRILVSNVQPTITYIDGFIYVADTNISGPIISKINIRNGHKAEIALPDTMVTIVDVPMAAQFKDNLLVIGDSNSIIINPENGLNNLLPEQNFGIDFNHWSSLFNMTNGDVVLMGLDIPSDATPGLLTIYLFNTTTFMFELRYANAIPGNSTERPSIIVTGTNKIGLIYPTETLWF